MAISDPTAIQMAVPEYPIDQIIGTITGSFTVAAATAVGQYATNTTTYDTGFGESCYYQGIFSIDSGTTWNDLGVYQPNLSTSGSPVFQTTTCQAYVTSAGVLTLVGKNWYDYVHSSSSSKTIQYQIFLIAKNTQGSITPLSNSQTLFYTSQYNYQKVFDADEFAVSTSASTVVTHSLGYVPKVRAWFRPTSTTSGGDGIYALPAGAMTTLDWFLSSVQISSTSVGFAVVADAASTPSGINGTMEYKIYLDS